MKKNPILCLLLALAGCSVPPSGEGSTTGTIMGYSRRAVSTQRFMGLEYRASARGYRFRAA